MSKTSASLQLETNMIHRLAQENGFMHNLFRLPPDFNSSFRRSASSNAPVQIFALASAQGDDTLAAMALQAVMRILEKETAEAQTRSVLDFPNFSEQLIQDLNTSVCNFSIKNNGSPIRVSVSIILLEGDTLRLIHVGNTRAVLIRDGKVIPLSENQTIAHRYVQTGAISSDAEKTHPERNVLTQYIGRFIQDGPVHAEKSVFLKLQPGDEIALLGTGIDEALDLQSRDAILTSPSHPEYKTEELIRLAQMNIKGGLSALIIRIDETMVMPSKDRMNTTLSGVAIRGQKAPISPDASKSEPVRSILESRNQEEGSGSQELSKKAGKGVDELSRRRTTKPGSKLRSVLMPIGIFVGFALAGYLGLTVLFRLGNFIPASTTPTESMVESLGKVKYVTADLVSIYPQPSLDAEPSGTLSKGEVVTYFDESGSFSRVKTTGGTEGYVLTALLTDQDPTIGETLAEMHADPTPIPTQEQTAVTTPPSEASAETTKAVTESTQAEMETLAPETSETTVPTESSTQQTSESESKETTSKPTEQTTENTSAESSSESSQSESTTETTASESTTQTTTSESTTQTTALT